MSASITRFLAHRGYNDCLATREEAFGKAARKRPAPTSTPSAIRANIRKNVILNAQLLAMPENEWQRDQLKLNRGVGLNRYRLALSSMRAERKPSLPGFCDHQHLAIAAE